MSDHSVFAPLLPSDHVRHSCSSDGDDNAREPHVILTVDELSTGGDTTNVSEVDDNPYAFIGANRFDMPGSTTVDPFRNNTPKIQGLYEWLKIVVCLPIALLRLVLFGLSLMVGYVATRIALQGWKDRNNPMPKWRSRLMYLTRFSARTILFSFGYQWIRRKGKPAPRAIAPIVVSNHVSYIDPIFFFYELFPTIVASESHDSMPFVGTIIRAMQVIYVNRFSPTSRKHAVNEIKRKASCDQFPRVLLFPEGTTTNGRSIISFQLGAFIPGYPIQPVIVRYPHVHFDQSWGNVSLAMLMFRMFTQFHNFMEVEYLPVITPHENRKESASRFAQRTGHAVASALNVVQTSHSYGDVLLLSKALEANQENPSLYLVEMAGLEAAFHLSSLEAVDFLDVFLSMNPDSRGQVEMHDFLKVLRLKPCNLSEKMFGFIDVQNSGKITFKQFLVGSAHILKQPLFHQACESAFTACDSDGKNYILEQEFGDSLMLSIPGSSNNEIHGLFTLFDADGDGKISRDDFIVCLRRYPLLIALFSPCLLRQIFP
ncbi:Lysophospholipid acyltransferase LPEAT2 [Capsicum annuum]|uniref:Lysophospholipid acyltransferase LPEAT2 n=1 Tax=Capsicum annuum TaxID=4072 RepID=A0A1U8GTY1_CAPAN|nr:lysophospholipid acyltransferase LPEAT2 isoform X3 [Capsicum annuum]PHT93497.1 Lysophospholipid acyltransferase LPEAT2 [Capsicum annuum]